MNNAPQSYWIDSTVSPSFPSLTEDVHVDVAIIGGGIVGISTGYMLSQQGINVVILEAGRILQATTGHTTAKVTSQHGLIYCKIKNRFNMEMAQQYADANETAIREIAQIAKTNGIECDLVHQDAYVYTQQTDNLEKIREEVEVANELGIKASFVEELPIGIPIKGAVRFENQAQFHPRKFLIPLADKIIANGSKIYEQTRVVRLEEDEHTLLTEQGNKVTADKIIIASHYPCINKPGFYFTRIHTERSYVVAVRTKEKYPGGMYINAEDPTRSLRNQQTEEGELILVGGENHKTGQGEDTRLHYEALVDYAHSHFKVEDTPYRWSTQDCMTLDDLPYVGQFTANSPHIFVATGFGKWGMTNSVASAMVLRDLIIDGKSPWQDVYSPARKNSLQSMGTFIAQNANVAKELLAGKMTLPSSNGELQRGEGKVIDYKGKRAGAFLDQEGKLHVVDTTCTHMGCELQWNTAETTWDCPCHGSRFSYTGDVVEGPAVRPLHFHDDVNTVTKLLTDNF
jgi:glycine/D-amino acid oxidase-like deaminating enzyme/nitrite reductase/ring-hydroxylating ferredoxin subunit